MRLTGIFQCNATIAELCDDFQYDIVAFYHATIAELCDDFQYDIVAFYNATIAELCDDFHFIENGDIYACSR